MMHEREQRMIFCEFRGYLRENAESKTVDDNRATRRGRHEPRSCGGALRSCRMRKTLAEIDDIDHPTQLLDFRDHPAIVGIAAGRRGKVARHRKRNAPHHKGASYQARATGDSEIVTRIAFSSRPSRPSLPPRADSASRP